MPLESPSGLGLCVSGLLFAALAALAYGLLARYFDAVPKRVAGIHQAAILLLLGPHLFLGGSLLPYSKLASAAATAGAVERPSADNPLHHDLIVQLLPIQEQVRRAWRAGHPPLRDASAGNGLPLWADPQAEVAQPLAALALPLEAERGLVLTAALRLFFALTFTFLLLRRVGCGEVAAAAGSLAFGLGGWVQLWLAWPLATAAAHLPFVLYALARTRSEVRRRDLGLLVVAVFCLATAGHPESVAYALLFTVAAAVAFGWRGPAAGQRRRRLGIAAGLLLGVGLAALAWLPAAAAARIGERAFLMARTAAAGVRTAEAPLGQRAVSLLAPEAFGNSALGRYWGESNSNEDASGFVGLAALLLAAVALARRPEAHHQWLARSATAAALLVVLRPPPLDRLLDLGPIGLFSASHGKRLLLLVGLGLAWLAAEGLERAKRRPPSPRLVLGLALVLAAAALASYLAFPAPPGPASGADRRLLIAASQLIALGLTAAALLLRTRRFASGWLAIGAIAFELGVAHAPANRPTWADLHEHGLAAETAAAYPGVPVLATEAALPRNLPSLFGLPAVTVSNPMQPFACLLPSALAQLDPGWLARPEYRRWLDVAGARLVLMAREEEPALSAGLRPLLADRRAATFANPSVRPMFAFAEAAAEPPAESAAAFLLEEPQVALGRLAAAVAGQGAGAAEWLLASAPPAGVTWIAGAARFAAAHRPHSWDRLGLLDRRPHRLLLQIDPFGPRLLVSQLCQDGGWRARLDGRPLPVERANGPYLAFWVPGGPHRIELIYRPPGLTAALAVSGAALLALGLILGAAPLWRRSDEVASGALGVLEVERDQR